MTSPEPATRFCSYCRRDKPNKGFKTVLLLNSPTKRHMCPACQEVRKLPRDELERLAAENSKRRKP